MINTVEQRQLEVVMALAAARGVSVRHIRLQGDKIVPVWDLSRTVELIQQGYQITLAEIQQKLKKHQPRWLSWLIRWFCTSFRR